MALIDELIKRTILRASADMNEYLNLCVLTRAANPSWRKGQTYFNVLSNVRPDIAESIRGTDLDPFHDDSKIGEFLTYVAKVWGNR